MTKKQKDEIRTLKGANYSDAFIDRFEKEWNETISLFKKKRRKKSNAKRK